MRYLLMLIIAIWNIQAMPDCSKPRPLDQLRAIQKLLEKHSVPQAVPPKELAPVILKLSKQYRLDAVLVASIVLIESKGDANAFNSRTLDYGLMQINHRTARAYGVGPACLMHWPCNLETGMRVLADFGTRRPCSYNVGYKKLKGATLLACESYENKIAYYQGGIK